MVQPARGGTSFLFSALGARTGHDEACALIDGSDTFDPCSAAAAGVDLKKLLWVRCHSIDQTLRATDLLLQSGGFGFIAVDVSDISPEAGSPRAAGFLVPVPPRGGRYAHNFAATVAGIEREGLRFAGFAAARTSGALAEACGCCGFFFTCYCTRRGRTTFAGVAARGLGVAGGNFAVAYAACIAGIFCAPKSFDAKVKRNTGREAQYFQNQNELGFAGYCRY